MNNATQPLRKIVKRLGAPAATALAQMGQEIIPNSATIPYELLECGHIQMPIKDIYGETNAVRRRCRYCGRGDGVLPEYAAMIESIKAAEAKKAENTQKQLDKILESESNSATATGFE